MRPSVQSSTASGRRGRSDGPPHVILFASARSAASVEAAALAGPDLVVIDLEHSVPPEQKESSRADLVDLVDRARRLVPQVAVRVNAAGTDWFVDDVRAASASGCDVVVLPHASAPDVHRLRNLLRERASGETSAGLLSVWMMLERVRDVLAVRSVIRHATPDAVVIGYLDLCTDLGLPFSVSHAEVDGLRSLVADAARGAGVLAVDGVVPSGHLDVEGECRRSVEAGFDARALYVPDQAAACRRAFERG
ncbi:MAG: aldolase/citrate lyase family protein [Dermatophilaceae bacterium]